MANLTIQANARLDAELILQAYETGGDDCVKHLIGDFSFAIWDGRKQRYFCARDHFGVKPFYYTYIDNEFANSRLMQANAAVEWQVLPDTSLTVTYLFVDGTDLPRSIDRNIGPLGSRTFTVAGTGETFEYHFFGSARPFGSFQRVIAFESTNPSSIRL